eukprot:TRINITY_DN9434_c0_g1_i1.p2 TRINITY_DN9434_c0_g1~~TRINITY_DN9434_c0_g1_i1.p2  ORF type:complete len:276 (+),score=139.80 TRINITY_DN9434_c0_g1_i1:51-830(+)
MAGSRDGPEAPDAGGVVEAARRGDVEALAQAAEAGPDALSGDGESPLLAAAASGGTDALVFLLERGADPNVKGKGGFTALHIAVQRKAVDDVKQLMLFGAALQPADGGETPRDLAGDDAAIKAELAKKRPAVEKARAMAERFKEQGNKAFAAGEYVKGTRFYSLAIAYDPTNHVLFSNRSACSFNRKKYVMALADATQCIRLKADWPKGYFRKGKCLHAAGDLDAAKAVLDRGLKLEPKDKNLQAASDALQKDLKARRK